MWNVHEINSNLTQPSAERVIKRFSSFLLKLSLFSQGGQQ